MEYQPLLYFTPCHHKFSSLRRVIWLSFLVPVDDLLQLRLYDGLGTVVVRIQSDVEGAALQTRRVTIQHGHVHCVQNCARQPQSVTYTAWVKKVSC